MGLVAFTPEDKGDWVTRIWQKRWCTNTNSANCIFHGLQCLMPNRGAIFPGHAQQEAADGTMQTFNFTKSYSVILFSFQELVSSYGNDTTAAGSVNNRYHTTASPSTGLVPINSNVTSTNNETVGPTTTPTTLYVHDLTDIPIATGPPLRTTNTPSSPGSTTTNPINPNVTSTNNGTTELTGAATTLHQAGHTEVNNTNGSPPTITNAPPPAQSTTHAQVNLVGVPSTNDTMSPTKAPTTFPPADPIAGNPVTIGSPQTNTTAPPHEVPTTPAPVVPAKAQTIDKSAYPKAPSTLPPADPTEAPSTTSSTTSPRPAVSTTPPPAYSTTVDTLTTTKAPSTLFPADTTEAPAPGGWFVDSPWFVQEGVDPTGNANNNKQATTSEPEKAEEAPNFGVDFGGIKFWWNKDIIYDM